MRLITNKAKLVEVDMKQLLFAVYSLLLLASVIVAQPRPIEKSSNPNTKPAPAAFEAKYEGGLFGFTEKAEGTLKFDDENGRLAFYGKTKKEMFSIPFESLIVIYPTSESVTSTTGNVVKNIPLPGAGLAGLIKEKRRYLVLQFDDPDADVKGMVNFKIENKELLDSVIQTLGVKANMTQRGDAFYRPRTTKSLI